MTTTKPLTLAAAFPLAHFASVIDLDYTDSQGERRHAGYSGADVLTRAGHGLKIIRDRGAKSITATVTWVDSVEQAELAAEVA